VFFTALSVPHSISVKLVVLGGSSIASPEFITALGARAPDLPIELALVGRDANKLERVGRVCAQLASASPNLRVEWTSDVPRALDGAQFVLNQIRVGGLAARAFDESFPHEFNLPGEETVGPGGFANALRTVPVCIEYARQVQQYAPDAWFINLTNPAGIIQAALERATNLRVVSVCDSPVTLSEQVAKLVDVPLNQLKIDYVGMLHFGWIVRVMCNGEDLMPHALANIAQLPGLYADVRLIQAMGALPSPYLNYFFAPDVMLARQRAKGHTRAEELQQLEAKILGEYDAGNFAASQERAAVWYEKSIVPVLRALASGGEHIVNTRNGNAMPWLSSDTIIETRCQISAQGITPELAPSIPPDIQAMLQGNAAYESLVVDAILEDSYDTAWRALRLNPLIANADQAREILDLVWATRGFPPQ
jgi:6-phospho-beta-glucosidase